MMEACRERPRDAEKEQVMEAYRERPRDAEKEQGREPGCSL